MDCDAVRNAAESTALTLQPRGNGRINIVLCDLVSVWHALHVKSRAWSMCGQGEIVKDGWQRWGAAVEVTSDGKQFNML